MKTTRLFWATLLLFVGYTIPAVAVTCEQQCWLDYDNCSCGDYWSCAACDEARDNCLNYCASHPCPATRDYSTTTLLSAQQTGNGCVEEYFSARHGCWFSKYLAQYRRTNYRETTNCDGTTTTTVLSSSTFPITCFKRQNPFACSSCSPYLLYLQVEHCQF